MSLDRLKAQRFAIAKNQLLEPPVAATTHHLGAETNLDVVGRFDLANQVLRHAGTE